MEMMMEKMCALPAEGRIIGHMVRVNPDLISADLPADGFGVVIGLDKKTSRNGKERSIEYEPSYLVYFFTKPPPVATRRDFALHLSLCESKLHSFGPWLDVLLQAGRVIKPGVVEGRPDVTHVTTGYTMSFLKNHRENAMLKFPYDKSLLPICSAVLASHYTMLMRCQCTGLQCISDHPSTRTCDPANDHPLPASMITDLSSW